MTKDNSTEVYKKIGRRYVRMGYEFTGFPAEGLWLVQRRPYSTSEPLILKVGELPGLYPYAQLAVDENELASAISDRMRSGAYSPSELAAAVMKWIAKKAEKK